MVREKVLQALYAYELSKEPINNIVETILDELRPHKPDFDFAKKLIHEVITHEAELEGYIKATVDHWEFERIAIIDRMLLRMGICEMLFFEDIPPKVTINESIEVAKTFSTEKSGRFINGVLDAILEDLRSKNKIVKTGRGLINDPIPNDQQKSRKRPKGR